MLELLEKLINEHGSSTILKQRLRLIAAEYAALEQRHVDLDAQHQAQGAELEQLRAQVGALQRQLDALQSRHGRHVCDHCGSLDLTRIGSRPDPVFGELGAKLAVYRCAACGGETTIAIDP